MEEDSTNFEFDFSLTTLGRIGQSLFLLNYSKRKNDINGIQVELAILHDELLGIIGSKREDMVKGIEGLRSSAMKEYKEYINAQNNNSRRLPSVLLFEKMRDWELGIRTNTLFSKLNLKEDGDAGSSMI